MEGRNFSTYYPERINMHVPDMQYHSDVGESGFYRAYYPAYVTADADGILAAQSIATASSTETFAAAYIEDPDDAVHVMGRFGRNVTVAASGAATSTVTVTGRDYLNQPMTEQLTLNGAATVQGVKAFKYIDRVAWGATGGTTINLGWGDKLGVPFLSSALISELVSNAAPTAGSLTAGALPTTTQTATTADPRGLYVPHSSAAPNGSRTYQLILRAYVNSLMGNAHYSA